MGSSNLAVSSLPALKQVDETTYKTEKDNVTVEVGDSKQSEFRPGIKYIDSKFDSNFGFALADKGGGVFFDKETGKVLYKKGPLTAEFYPTSTD